MNRNEIDFKVQEAGEANGTKSTSQWFQATNSMEWWSAVASVR